MRVSTDMTQDFVLRQRIRAGVGDHTGAQDQAVGRSPEPEIADGYGLMREAIVGTPSPVRSVSAGARPVIARTSGAA